MSLLQIKDVTHRYPTTTGDRPVLDRVSIDLPEESILAVVGESGCGKTTLGRLVTRLARPVEGTVSFEGSDIWSMRGKALQNYRRGVQMVQQDPYASLNPGLTVRDSLAPGLRHNAVVRRREIGDELLRLLEIVGLDPTQDFLRRYPHQLSGGQRQRLAIARAISLRPQLVVADEAVSMLDVSMRVSILDLMLSLRETQKLSYLFISHDFGVVRYFARGGRIVVMFYGVVVEEGPAEEVINRPRHPYTYLLLQAIPVPDPDLADRRKDEDVSEHIEGEPASVGCVFANRCPFAEAKCRASRPPMNPISDTHSVECFFPERVPDLDAMRAPEGGSDA
ncbi:MAG TPA: ABC transporter ATP-binding protein [Mycobacteriales bacterium]|nr:ABC transporter ATP-binding protein [Mycobacteriales bacterium]